MQPRKHERGKARKNEKDSFRVFVFFVLSWFALHVVSLEVTYSSPLLCARFFSLVVLFGGDAGPLLHETDSGLMQPLFGEFFLHPLYLVNQQAREDQGASVNHQARKEGQELEDRLQGQVGCDERKGPGLCLKGQGGEFYRPRQTVQIHIPFSPAEGLGIRIEGKNPLSPKSCAINGEDSASGPHVKHHP